MTDDPEPWGFRGGLSGEFQVGEAAPGFLSRTLLVFCDVLQEVFDQKSQRTLDVSLKDLYHAKLPFLSFYVYYNAHSSQKTTTKLYFDLFPHF